MPIPLFTDGSNSPVANINWAGFDIVDLGHLKFGSSSGLDPASPSLTLYQQTSGTPQVNIGNTSLIASPTQFLLQPTGGGTYSWDAFNHFQLPPASVLMETGLDNNPASSFGKNQIVAGTFSDYTWSRYYSIHAGTRLSVGADSSSVPQVGGALNAKSPADKTLGTSSANNSTTISSSGTFFKRDVGIGDYIQLQGLSAIGKVLSISSDTSMVLDTALGDGTSRNIILRLDSMLISDNSGNIAYKVQHDGTVTVGDRFIYTPNYNFKRVSSNTLNNSPTVILTLPLQPSSSYLLDASVSAITQDQSQRGGFKRMATVYRNGNGVATIQGVGFHEFSQQSGAYSVEWVVSGNNAQLQVIGDASLQVNWGATISYQEFIGG